MVQISGIDQWWYPKTVQHLPCFLPFGKAEHTPYPSLPRVCGSTLQLHPWTPCICGILDFCNVGVNFVFSDSCNIFGRKLYTSPAIMSLFSVFRPESLNPSLWGGLPSNFIINWINAGYVHPSWLFSRDRNARQAPISFYLNSAHVHSRFHLFIKNFVKCQKVPLLFFSCIFR